MILFALDASWTPSLTSVIRQVEFSHLDTGKKRLSRFWLSCTNEKIVQDVNMKSTTTTTTSSTSTTTTASLVFDLEEFLIDETTVSTAAPIRKGGAVIFRFDEDDVSSRSRRTHWKAAKQLLALRGRPSSTEKVPHAEATTLPLISEGPDEPVQDLQEDQHFGASPQREEVPRRRTQRRGPHRQRSMRQQPAPPPYLCSTGARAAAHEESRNS